MQAGRQAGKRGRAVEGMIAANNDDEDEGKAMNDVRHRFLLNYMTSIKRQQNQRQATK